MLINKTTDDIIYNEFALLTYEQQVDILRTALSRANQSHKLRHIDDDYYICEALGYTQSPQHEDDWSREMVTHPLLD